MTGYGRENYFQNSRKYQIEIKSVNHRYSDISVKMPRIISYLENSIKKEVSEYIKRGKVEIFINFEDNSTDSNKLEINREIAKIYIDELKKLADSEKLSSNIEIVEISKFPDVMKMKNDINEEIIKKELLEGVKRAAISLISMRKKEGKQIFQDMNNRIDTINIKINEINTYSTGLIGDYVVKLENRVKELTKEEIDKTRIMQEVVIYADKCSVEEEIIRLKSHILQFRELLNSEDSVGKKLDFIIQEMNR